VAIPTDFYLYFLESTPQVYSRSKDKWIAATVRKIMVENGQEWIQVYYKNSTQMKVNPFSPTAPHPHCIGRSFTVFFSWHVQDVRADSDDIRECKTAPVATQAEQKKSKPASLKGFPERKEGGAKIATFTMLLHKIAAISRQVEGGLYLVKRVASVVHRISQTELAHVASLTKVIDQVGADFPFRDKT
jgi:hypothetical protein